MGLAASQARFLQLTARKSNVEFQAQQINFQRLQLASNLQDASSEYQDKISNKKLVYKFNNGTGPVDVDVTYNNYKNYINQQAEGLSTSQDKYYLLAAGSNRIVVASEEERDKMIEKSKDTGENLSPEQFIIEKDLEDSDKFQQSIMDGKYYFAKHVKDDDDNYHFVKEEWGTMGNGAIKEEYDKEDDAEAQAKFDHIEKEIQKKDKAMEMELNKLDTERNAIQTELDSVNKVIEDNIEQTFKTFG